MIAKNSLKVIIPDLSYFQERLHPCPVFFLLHFSFTVSTISYTTGTKKTVSIKEDSKPPMITQANPFFHSAEVPVPSAIGSIPIAMERVVIRMGLIRPLLAATIASLRSEERRVGKEWSGR